MIAFRGVALLSFGVGVYAVVGYAFWPVGALVHPDMRASFEAHSLGVRLHAFCAAFALLLGPLQFMPGVRATHPAIHRLCGRLYLAVGVGVGGISGLYISAFAFGGFVSSAGFALLALAWLYTGIRAYVAVRSRAIGAHRRWMTRNYALAFAAVTLRIYVGLGMAAGGSFETIYPWIAWLCWLPNIALAEHLLRRTASPTGS